MFYSPRAILMLKVGHYNIKRVQKGTLCFCAGTRLCALVGFVLFFFNQGTSGNNLLNGPRVKENTCLSAFYTLCINLSICQVAF